MAEYASKGVAGTGLGLGIAGTALGVLAGSNGGNGLLGGLFGGGPNLQGIIAAKDAVCPEYMNRYNAWVAPTNTTPSTGA